MKKVLITGSSGFIGRNLSESLSSNYEVFAPSHDVFDLLDTEGVHRYLSEHSFDTVVHCANMNSLRYGQQESPLLIVDQNLRMFWNLCRCADLFGRMYYFGSGAEFDMRHYEANMSEGYFDRYVPQDAYGFSKYVMNQHARRSENIYNLRLFGVYGKYEEWNRRFISNNICRVLMGLDISINQDMQFDYLHINDLCRLVEKFIEITPRYHDYNVCTGKPIRLSEIAAILKITCGSQLPIRIKAAGEKLPYTADNRRMLSEFGTWNFTAISTGIQELWDFYCEQVRTDPVLREKLKHHDFG